MPLIILEKKQSNEELIGFSTPVQIPNQTDSLTWPDEENNDRTLRTNNANIYPKNTAATSKAVPAKIQTKTVSYSSKAQHQNGDIKRSEGYQDGDYLCRVPDENSRDHEAESL